MKLAVIIPCLNEEATVGKVVRDCRVHLPEATIYVLDNGSQDATAREAQAHGAKVVHSPLRGKGHVLRHAFRVLDADFYVMIDGDGTYPLSEARRLIALAASQNYEMVMGARLELGQRSAFRPLHYMGNHILTSLVRLLFRYPVRDLLTGYRIFSRRFVENAQLISTGFEVETEFTIRALAQDLAFAEVSIPYHERPQNSHSKLRTFRDGFKILRTILGLWRTFRPLAFHATSAVLFLGVAFLFPRLEIFFSVCAALFLTLGFYLDAHLALQRMNLRFSRSEHATEKPLSRVA